MKSTRTVQGFLDKMQGSSSKQPHKGINEENEGLFENDGLKLCIVPATCLQPELGSIDDIPVEVRMHGLINTPSITIYYT